jgi:hypothetical protein
MGTSEKIILVAVIFQPPNLTVETHWFPDQAPQIHSIPVTPDEIVSFNFVLSARPFGAFDHVISLESISSVGNKFTCTVRVSCNGSRQTQTFQVSEATFTELEAVFDSNIISEDYTRA